MLCLVRLDARLAVGVDAHQPAFDDRRQHQHLHELADRVLGQGRQHDVGRRPGGVGVRLVRALERRVAAGPGSRLRLNWFSSSSLRSAMPTMIGGCFGVFTTRLLMTLSRVPSWCCWPRLCRSRVWTAVSGVGPRPCLPSDSAEQLVVPQAERFELLRPDRQHAGRLLQLLGHQVVDGGVLQDRVALERLFEEALGHRRGAEQQGAHVEAHRPRPAAGRPA